MHSSPIDFFTHNFLSYFFSYLLYRNVIFHLKGLGDTHISYHTDERGMYLSFNSYSVIL